MPFYLFTAKLERDHVDPDDDDHKLSPNTMTVWLHVICVMYYYLPKKTLV